MRNMLCNLQSDYRLVHLVLLEVLTVPQRLLWIAVILCPITILQPW
jgi:hypothetical protein